MAVCPPPPAPAVALQAATWTGMPLWADDPSGRMTTGRCPYWSLRRPASGAERAPPPTSGERPVRLCEITPPAFQDPDPATALHLPRAVPQTFDVPHRRMASASSATTQSERRRLLDTDTEAGTDMPRPLVRRPTLPLPRHPHAPAVAAPESHSKIFSCIQLLAPYTITITPRSISSRLVPNPLDFEIFDNFFIIEIRPKLYSRADFWTLPIRS